MYKKQTFTDLFKGKNKLSKKMLLPSTAVKKKRKAIVMFIVMYRSVGVDSSFDLKCKN